MKVNEVMSSTVHSCSINITLDKIARIMWKYNCDTIVIVDDNNKPIGMITGSDMSCALNHKAIWELEASNLIANQRLVYCVTSDNISIALLVMKNRKLHRLPVIDEAGCLVGIISIDDITDGLKKGKNVKPISYDVTPEGAYLASFGSRSY